MIKSHINNVKKQVSKDQSIGAQRDLIEQLFDDHYKNRLNVYKMNFVRGIFFGVGSVLGATIVVSIIIWTLSQFVQLPDNILQQVENKQQQTVQ